MLIISGMAKTRLGYHRKKIPKHIREWINYNPDTGVLTWAKDKGIRVKAGQVVAENNSAGLMMFERELYMKHRVAYYLHTGKQPRHVCFRSKNKNDLRVNNLFIRLI